LPSKHNPADCLADIVDNAERIDGYIVGLDQKGFERNGLLRDGVERCLERVCEAVYRLGDQAELLMPGQPWGEIRGMGKQLRHAYDPINVQVVWSTVRYDLPGLATRPGNRSPPGAGDPGDDGTA
jgi:uncharacterized protein with HEPN domain